MKNKIVSFLESLKQDNVKMMYVAAAFIFLFAIIILGFIGKHFVGETSENYEPKEDSFVEKKEDKKDCSFKRIIDGVCVNSSTDVAPDLVAVMVENHPEARPQSGLSEASIVYEAPVEANYSRFMLVYPLGQEVLKVGPVRSARPYYLDWLSEYRGVMYMHVGGSPEALDKIKEFDIFNVNEFYNGWYYWRSKDRHAPHNVYTNSELWEDAFDSNQLSTNYEQENLDGWKFGEMEECEVGCVNEITVSFLPPTYEAVWKYNSSTSKYARHQMGYPHTDKDGTLIEADTIIVQYVETEIIDDIGRISMETIGSGDVIVFRNGSKIEGEWSKSSREDRTKFFDVDGNEIVLQAGNIWVEVMNQRGELQYN